MTPYVICTDLDGTLLDHHTYSWQSAIPAMSLAQKQNIPIIINTSKTAAEVVLLQHAMGIQDAFIVENGSAIYLPKKHNNQTIQSPEDVNETYLNETYLNEQYDVSLQGCKRERVVEFLQSMREELGFKFEMFSDWSLSELIKHTGLDQASAGLSMARNYSESLLWLDEHSKFDEFEALVRSKGFNVLKGGRFIHILGLSDKGSAIQCLMNQSGYSGHSLIALGDGDNDLEMICVADFPVLVRSPVNAFPCLNSAKVSTKNKIIYTEKYGPAGWNAAILDIIKSK